MAGTSGIADDDGTTDAVFAYRWLADDAAIGGRPRHRWGRPLRQHPHVQRAGQGPQGAGAHAAGSDTGSGRNATYGTRVDGSSDQTQ